MRISLIGMVVNAVLAFAKLVAGILGHSYALVADGVESLADILSSLVVWGGLRIASIPADRDHPYGHGKAEPLAALVVSLMLLGAGIAIAVEAIREIITPHRAPAAFTLWVLLAVVCTKEVLFRVVRRVAGQVNSGAVLADAWHHRSDAITSVAAGVGISVALIGGPGYEPADDWAALVASAVILYNASRICVRPLRELMDAEPVEIVAQVREVAASVPGVAGIEKVFARKHGMKYWLDMHVEVDPQMSVRDAHLVAHAVKDRIRERLPAVQDVLVHVEPHDGLHQVAGTPVVASENPPGAGPPSAPA